MSPRTPFARRARPLALLIAPVLLIGCFTPPPEHSPAEASGGYAALQRYMSEYIRYEMDRSGTVGLSVAVVDDQVTVWAQGFGFADRDAGRPATADTVYRVGSISKLLTATAVMQLAEDSRLDIDRPLQRYLPEFTIQSRFPDTPPVTPRSLLTHHSGLPGNLLKGLLIDCPPPPDYTRRFLSLPAALGDTWLNQPPGKVWAYSNLGYALLGCLVERVSGEPFVPYMEQHVLTPLGMRNSSFVEREDLQSELAAGYSGGREQKPYLIRDIPAGGLVSSVNDLARYVKMIFASGRGAADGRVLQPATLRRMLTPQNGEVPLDVDFRIGLGFWLVDPLHLPGVDLASHGGDIPPFHSLLVTLPQQKLGVVLITNTDEGAAILFRIGTEAVLRALEAKTGLPAAVTPRGHAAADDPAAERELTGLYASPMGLIEVDRRGRHLAATVYERTFRLYPREDGSFGLTPRPALLSDLPVQRSRLFAHFLLRIQALEETSVTSHEIGGRRCVALRPGGVFMGLATPIDPVPVPPEWRARAGRYGIANPDPRSVLGEVRLEYDRRREVLLLELQVFDQRMSFPLQVLSDREAVVAGEGRNLGDTVTVVSVGGEERLLYSGYQLARYR